EAGWGGWDRVERLLAGQSWLDSVASGLGWNLLGRARSELGRFAESGDALGRYLAVATAGDRERGLVELRRGLALLGAGDAAEALSAFDRGRERIPELGDWAAVFAARAAAQMGDTAAVRARLAGVDPYF